MHFEVLTSRASVWHFGEAQLDTAFLCHKTKKAKDSEKFTPEEATIGEGANTFPVLVSKVGGLCSPAQVDDQPVGDATTHLQTFGLKGELAEGGRHALHGLFGSLVVDVKAPHEIRTGSAMSRDDVQPGAPESGPAFACAKIALKKRFCVGDPGRKCKTDDECGEAAPCFLGKNLVPKNGACVGNPKLKCKTDGDCGVEAGPCALGTAVSDGLAGPIAVALTKPTVLCESITLNDKPSTSTASHLLCYGVNRTKQCDNPNTVESSPQGCLSEEKCGGAKGTKYCRKEPLGLSKSLKISSVLGIELQRDTKKESELCIPVTVE